MDDQVDVLTDEAGELCRVDVLSDQGRTIGGWKPGYRDVWAHVLRDKDGVRQLVREAIGRHVMERSTRACGGT